MITTAVKVRIHSFSPSVHQQKGFPSGPFHACLTAKCGRDRQGSACCAYGTSVDSISYHQLSAHRSYFEEKLGMEFTRMFADVWLEDPEYPGGRAIRSSVQNNMCVFTTGPGMGCEIVRYTKQNHLPDSMIPAACRLYPVTWNQGELFVDQIQENCICTAVDNPATQSIFETQYSEIKDIFEF